MTTDASLQTVRLTGIAPSLEARPWSCLDFYVEDLDGYVLCFSEPLSRG